VLEKIRTARRQRDYRALDEAALSRGLKSIWLAAIGVTSDVSLVVARLESSKTAGIIGAIVLSSPSGG